jgi:hypothetical protein
MDEESVDDQGLRRAKSVAIVAGAAPDSPVPYSNHMLVNYGGSEFVVSFMQAIAPIFKDARELPDQMEARVLFRVAVPVEKWVEFMTAATAQIDALRRSGALPASTETD